MLRINSLRFRVAFFYAFFGALLSILFSWGVFLFMQNAGHRLVDEILNVELAEHAGYPNFFPPSQFPAYILSGSQSSPDIPPEVGELLPGNHNLILDGTEYRVLVADMHGARYFMLFDMQRHHFHRTELLRYMVIFAVLTTIISLVGGFWLGGRVTAPVTRLAEQVGKAEPSDANLPLLMLEGQDEVGELARAFDRYVRRMREFIRREKYFKADVSHELRTPLAIMLGTVEVLEQDETLSPKQRERIGRIRRAAQDMTDLTAALLLMAREPQPSADEPSCHVAEVAQACIEKHRHLIGDRPVRLEWDRVAEPNLAVERPLLEIVIGNLIRNALLNTPSGSILLRLEADRLIVRDTGSGMRPEELSHALELYYKGASSAGAGVGLSLVKRICERYGWRISLDSEVGRGTTAQINFG